MNYIFEHTDKVRDYECDLQAIVNNANYQHYLEHTRHEFMLTQGFSFAELHDEGCDWVVARIDISYKIPLRSRDEYVCKLALQKEGIKYTFYQAIYRKADMKLCAKAKVDTVAVVHGKLSTHPRIDAWIEQFST